MLILAWLLVVFLVLGLPQILGWIDLSAIWTDQNTSDVGITILTVLPYFLYLTITEWKRPHATWGKRRTGITVTAREGGPPRGSAIIARNLVTVAPWQLGHMGTTRLVPPTDVSVSAVIFQSTSLLLLALIVLPVLLGRRGLHDVLASTTVQSVEKSS